MLENVIAVIKKLEWQEIDPDPYPSYYACPICYENQKRGHKDGCQIAAAIEEIGAMIEIGDFINGLRCGTEIKIRYRGCQIWRTSK